MNNNDNYPRGIAVTAHGEPVPSGGARETYADDDAAEQAQEIASRNSLRATERQASSGPTFAPTGQVSVGGGMATSPENAITILGYKPELNEIDPETGHYIPKRPAAPVAAPAAEQGQPGAFPEVDADDGGEGAEVDTNAGRFENSPALELATDQLILDGYGDDAVDAIHGAIADAGGLSDEVAAQLRDQGTDVGMVASAYSRVQEEQTGHARSVLGGEAFDWLSQQAALRPELRSQIVRHAMNVARGEQPLGSWGSFYQSAINEYGSKGGR